MSETPHSVVAPGLPGATVIESGNAPAPAASTPATPSAAPQAGETPQQFALRDVDRLRGELLKAAPEQRDAITRQIVARQRFAAGYGEKPADFMPEQKQAPDTRAHNPMLELDQQMVTPASTPQLEQAVKNAVVQGVDRGLAQQVAQGCGELGLCESHTRTILAAVRAHHGADHEFTADSGLRPLSESEIPEWHAEASRLAGGNEKFAALTERARAFLAHRGVLEEFDRRGYTSTSLAFDPSVLITLAAAADAAQLPRSKK